MCTWVCLILVTYVSMYVYIKLQACGNSDKDLMPIINRIEKTSYTPIKTSTRYFFFVGKGRIFFFLRIQGILEIH
jgi:hypothetical protein